MTVGTFTSGCSSIRLGEGWEGREGFVLVQRAQAFQELLCLFELREEFFFFTEGCGMHQPPAAAELHRMPQVQHLMIDKVLNGIKRDTRGIKDAADDDCVMRRIIVAKAAQGLIAAPCHLRTGHQAVEEAKIQVIENLVKIVVFALGTLNALASAQLADELRFFRHSMAASVFAVTCGVGSVNGLAMKLGNKDMEDGIEHRFGRAFKEIRKANKDASLAQADSAIDVGETIETDLKLRHRRAGTQIAICLLKNLDEGRGHVVLSRAQRGNPILPRCWQQSFNEV